MRRNAVWDGFHHYDYWYTDHHDAVPGTGTRFSSFRRVGATDAGAQPPPQVGRCHRVRVRGERSRDWLSSELTEIYLRFS
eukprot:COSAG01_NODE_4564_length_4919_cov_6.477386_5_plen_80_part_00